MAKNDIPFDLLQPKPQFITIRENEGMKLVHVLVRGVFPSPEEISLQLSAIRDLSVRYQSIELNISSPGGDGRSLIEFINSLRNYRNIITINAGDCASAAFILWCVGDVRVTYNHASFLAHRESYGFVGQTDSHVERAHFSDKLYARLFEKWCTDVLEDSEMHSIRHSDVLLSDIDMLDRNVCITIDEYDRQLGMEDTEFEGTLIRRGDNMFVITPEGMVEMVDELTFDSVWTTQFDFIFGREPSKLMSNEDIQDIANKLAKKMAEGERVLLEEDADDIGDLADVDSLTSDDITEE